ncbi:CopL family metal-binding regulatory protein [Gilvimarinus sp. DA14]|uniref:CopL family metal-binding regulatory protein n=1 Tax=Gilvimarinus sp. DA14 TaxID=2956798 RepID=UPI0020B89164|nr:CopL family metal-binding regulatory protein [Gilvimarinus sp. DA14]UTF59946.1 CopL family metal-binding regulatory protein [Gilvimarinus sp. DA14]
MIFRVLIILVLVAQGLVSFAAPVPASEISQSSAPMPAMTMQDCHGQMDMAAANTKKADTHCTENCCCPGVCNAAAALPGEAFSVVYQQATAVSFLLPQSLPNPISRLYRPPIFA